MMLAGRQRNCVVGEYGRQRNIAGSAREVSSWAKGKCWITRVETDSVDLHAKVRTKQKEGDSDVYQSSNQSINATQQYRSRCSSSNNDNNGNNSGGSVNRCGAKSRAVACWLENAEKG